MQRAKNRRIVVQKVIAHLILPIKYLWKS